MDWLRAVQQLRHDGQPGVLVTVIEVRGHAPREAGPKMVVSREYSWGSVGGGNLEATAVARARELMSSGAVEPEVLELRLSPHARSEHGRQCCGTRSRCSPWSRCSGSATSGTSWPASCPGCRSSCCWWTRAPSSWTGSGSPRGGAGARACGG